MRQFHCFLALVVCALAGCGRKQDRPPPEVLPVHGAPLSDVEAVRAADVSILFVGNSHTTFHDLPGLVARMIQFRTPGRTVYTHVRAVGFLEDAEHDTGIGEEIESRPWKHVVLQAQKESRSGKFNYPTAPGVGLAKRARAKGANAIFYSEWGLSDVPDHGARIEKIYTAMATESGASVAPVGRAWDRALSARPTLHLHSADGNHQSELGAFLSAAVLYGKLTDDSPAALATFPYDAASADERKFLAETAAQALAEHDAQPAK